MKAKTETKKDGNGFKETEIGLIPSDWDVVRLEEVSEKLKAGGTPKTNIREYWNGDTPLVKVEDVAACEKHLTKTLFSITREGLKSSSAWIVPKDSVLLSMYGTAGEVVINKIPVAVTQNILGIIKNDKITTEFLYYALIFSKNYGMSKITDKTIFKYFTLAKAKGLLFSLPSIFEQQKIAVVLSKIQQAIEHQDKIIQTTKELKKSLMNNLFTKGLHGEERKETEIGLIPKNWEVVKIQDCCEVVTGGTPKTEVKEYYENGNIRWMKSGDINGQLIYEVENRITDLGLKNSNARLMPKGTIVIALSGRGKTRGTTSILMVDCSCSQSVAGMIPDIKKIDSFYLNYFLSYIYEKIRDITGDKDRSGLNLGLIRQIRIIKPKDISEQKEIANILSSVDMKISQAESRKQTFQSLFKTMLNQLMTGRIRVKDLDIEVN